MRDLGGPWQDDGTLLARMRAGDDGALGLIYDHHADMVFGIARRVVVDDQLARDITQDVFVHVWEAVERIDLSRGSIRSYLGVVAHRRAVDAVRRSVRRARAEAADDCAVDEAPVDERVADADALAWCRDRLVDALEALPSEQRAAVTLVYFEDRTFKEAASILGIPEGTAKSRVRLGLARVRALAGDDLRRST